MSQIQVQLEQLLKTSFFLNPLQKKMILIKLEKSSDEDKKSLLNSLVAEKQTIKESLKKYLLQNGEEGMAKIQEILTKTKRKKHNIQEGNSKIQEEKKMAELLSGIEDL